MTGEDQRSKIRTQAERHESLVQELYQYKEHLKMKTKECLKYFNEQAKVEENFKL